MDVPNIQPVERHLVRVVGRTALRVTSLAVLLCFGQLGDDGDPYELLARELDGRLNRFLVLELDVAHTAKCQINWTVHNTEWKVVGGGLPFRSAADAVLDDLCFFHWSDLLEESNQLFGSQTSGELLHEDGTSITFVLRQGRRC